MIYNVIIAKTSLKIFVYNFYYLCRSFASPLPSICQGCKPQEIYSWLEKIQLFNSSGNIFVMTNVSSSLFFLWLWMSIYWYFFGIFRISILSTDYAQRHCPQITQIKRIKGKRLSSTNQLTPDFQHTNLLSTRLAARRTKSGTKALGIKP